MTASRKLLIVASGAGCVAAMLPAAASGLTYCVSSPGPGCDVNEPDVQAALNSAAVTGAADTVRVGPGTYVAPTPGFQYSSDDLDLVGAGASQTTLTRTATAAGGNVLVAGGGSNTSVSDLKMQIPTPLGGEEYRGVSSSVPLELDRVTVEAPDPFNGFGVILDTGGSIDDAVIDLPNQGIGEVNIGLATGGGSLSVTDTTVDADIGIRTDSGALTFSRSSMDTPFESIIVEGGTADISNSVIRTGYRAVSVANPNGTATAEQISATLDGVTLVAREPDPTLGVFVVTNFVPGVLDDHSATIRNTIFDPGIETPISRFADEGSRASVFTAYSRLDPAGNESVNDGNNDMTANGLGAINPLGGDVNLPPAFVNPGAGNYRLLPSSPLIDKGDPVLPPPGDTDRDGAPRVTVAPFICGVPAGPTRRDIGAYEFLPAYPLAQCLPGPFTPGPVKANPKPKCAKKKAKKRGAASAKKRKCKRKKKAAK